MKVKCPKCKEPITLDKNEHEEGDLVECEECGACAIVEVRGGSFRLKPEQSKYDDVPEEFFQGYDE